MSLVVKVDTKIPCLFNRVRAGSTFMSVKGYRNNHNEVSDFNIVFHFSYQNAVRKAINTWVRFQANSPLYIRAKNELIESYSRSLNKGDLWFSDHALRSPYARATDKNGALIDGVKVHVRLRELHLSGLLINKRVITPGNYPAENKSELTCAKEHLMRLTSLSNYRQFKLTNGRFESISVDSMTLRQQDLVRKMS